MTSRLDFVAIVITGLMVGNEFAIAAFVHPAISRLEQYPHVAAAKNIAGILGRVMPFWYGAGLLVLLTELWAKRTEPKCFRLLTVAAVLWGGAIVYTIAALVPRNNRIALADPDLPYQGWAEDRARWDSLHRIRVAVLACAFALLLACVISPG